MILYDPNKWMGFHKLVQLEGSVTMTVLPHCVLAALLAILVNQNDLIYFPSKAYGHQIFTYGLSFLVIMRTNLSYSRYWEGITACILMHSKWLDAAAQIIAFDELSKGAAAASGPKFRAHVVHIFGLMSATAMLELQGEDESELRNLVREYFPPGEEPLDEFQSHDVRPASPTSPASVMPLSGQRQEPPLSRSKSNLEGQLDDSGTDADFLPVIGQVTEGEYAEYHSAKHAEVPVHYWMQKNGSVDHEAAPPRGTGSATADCQPDFPGTVEWTARIRECTQDHCDTFPFPVHTDRAVPANGICGFGPFCSLFVRR